MNEEKNKYITIDDNLNLIKRKGNFNYKCVFVGKKLQNTSFFLNDVVCNSTSLYVYDNLIIKDKKIINLLNNKIIKTRFIENNNINNLMWICSWFYIEKFFYNYKKLKHKNQDLILQYDNFIKIYANTLNDFNDFYVKNECNDSVLNSKYDDLNKILLKEKNKFYFFLLNKVFEKKLIKIFHDNAFCISLKDNLLFKDFCYISIHNFDLLKLNILSESKGKGFAGVVKRYNYSKGPASHGSSLFHNRPGAIGHGINRVAPQTKLPGRMGKELILTKNLQIFKEKNILDIIKIKGSFAGYKNNNLKIII